MPLSKARMRERKRLDRNVKPKSNLNVRPDVKPKSLKPVQPNEPERHVFARLPVFNPTPWRK